MAGNNVKITVLVPHGFTLPWPERSSIHLPDNHAGEEVHSRRLDLFLNDTGDLRMERRATFYTSQWNSSPVLTERKDERCDQATR